MDFSGKIEAKRSSRMVMNQGQSVSGRTPSKKPRSEQNKPDDASVVSMNFSNMLWHTSKGLFYLDRDGKVLFLRYAEGKSEYDSENEEENDPEAKPPLTVGESLHLVISLMTDAECRDFYTFNILAEKLAWEENEGQEWSSQLISGTREKTFVVNKFKNVEEEPTEIIRFDNGRWKDPIKCPPSSLSIITQVAFGSTYGLALTKEQTLVFWYFDPDNSGTWMSWTNFNPLENEGRENLELPVEEVGGGQVVQRRPVYIASGLNFIGAVFDDGSVYTWGDNSFGQLGIGNLNQTEINSWQKIKIEEMNPEERSSTRKAASIIANGYSCAIISNDLTVALAGDNQKGQLGFGNQVNYKKFTINPSIYIGKVKMLALGLDHMLVLMQSGQLYGTGSNIFFKAGIYAETLMAASKQVITTLKEVQLHTYEGAFSSNERWTEVYAFAHCSYGVTNERRVFAWGRWKEVINEDVASDPLSKVCNIYRLSLVTTDLNDPEKERVDFITDENLVTDIAAGRDFAAALTKFGEVWVWGSNEYKQHALTAAKIKEPYDSAEWSASYTVKIKNDNLLYSKVPGLGIKDRHKVTQIAAGENYLLAVDDNILLWGWGQNNEGQLGVGFKSPDVSTPTKVLLPPGNSIKQVICGENHSLVLTKTNRLFGFGSNVDGKLGIGIQGGIPIFEKPVEIVKLSGMNIQKIATSRRHSLALVQTSEQTQNLIRKALNIKISADSRTAEIYSWGEGRYGKLGNKTQFREPFPTKIDLIGLDIVDIYCGSDHSACKTENGGVYIWGLASNWGILANEFTDSMAKDTYHIKDMDPVDGGHEKISCFLFPKQVTYFASKNLRLSSIALGFDAKRNYYIVSDGVLTSTKNTLEHFHREKLPPPTKLISRERFAVALTKETLYVWGFDDKIGRLGQGVETANKNNSDKNKRHTKQINDDEEMEPTALHTFLKLCDNKEFAMKQDKGKGNQNSILGDESGKMNTSAMNISGVSNNKSGDGTTEKNSRSLISHNTGEYDQKGPINNEDDLYYRFLQVKKLWENFLEEFKTYDEFRSKAKIQRKHIKQAFLDRLLEYPFFVGSSKKKNLIRYDDQLAPEELKQNMKLYSFMFTALSTHSCLLTVLMKNEMVMHNAANITLEVIGVVGESKLKVLYITNVITYLLEAANQSNPAETQSFTFDPNVTSSSSVVPLVQYKLLYEKLCKQESKIQLWISLAVDKFDQRLFEQKNNFDEFKLDFLIVMDEPPELRMKYETLAQNIRRNDYSERVKKLKELMKEYLDIQNNSNLYNLCFLHKSIILHTMRYWAEKKKQLAINISPNETTKAVAMMLYPILKRIKEIGEEAKMKKAENEKSTSDRERIILKRNNFLTFTKAIYAWVIGFVDSNTFGITQETGPWLYEFRQAIAEPEIFSAKEALNFVTKKSDSDDYIDIDMEELQKYNLDFLLFKLEELFEEDSCIYVSMKTCRIITEAIVSEERTIKDNESHIFKQFTEELKGKKHTFIKNPEVLNPEAVYPIKLMK